MLASWIHQCHDRVRFIPGKHLFLWCSAFFIVMVQLLHLYMTTAETIALTIWIFVGTVMSLLFSMLSRFVIAFLPRNKHLLILWLQSLSAVILEPKKNVTFSSICHEVTTSWEIDGETVETVSDFTFWAPKSLQMVTAATKLKELTPWKKSYDQPR